MVADKEKQPLIIVCGATATGKTQLAVRIAGISRGEVLSADSMQIYKKLDIGTAKVTEEEKKGIPHHLINIAEPQSRFSVADFTLHARPIIEDIGIRGKTAVVCGGTGLYIDSLCDGRDFADFDIPSEITEKLADKSDEELYEELCVIDEVAAKNIHANNRKRLVRALTVYYATGETFTDMGKKAMPSEKPYRTIIFHCRYTNRQDLYDKIELRVDKMLEFGVLEEALYVYENRTEFITAAAAIGYKEFFPYFDKTATLEECTIALKQATRRYAKRQLTWFSQNENAIILPAENPEEMFNIAKIQLEEFL